MADYRKDNASFMLYKNWKALFDSLTDEEAGQLIKAIFCFASGEDAPKLDRLISGMFLMITQQMNADGIKWEQTCERRKAGGCKGGRPPKEKGLDENLKDNEKTLRFSEKPLEPDKIREEKISKDKIREDINNNSHSTVRVSSSDFEKLWSLYPRKEGRKEAFAAYERAIKHGTTVETIENGIKAYCKHIEDCKIEKQYIKKGSTWFKQEAWNDVYDDNTSKDSETSYNMNMFEKFANTF